MADMDAVKLKRFLLFAGYDYYPTGGWADFMSSHETVEDAVIAVAGMRSPMDWWHVIDLESGDKAKSGGRQY